MGVQMEPYPELSDSFWKGDSAKFALKLAEKGLLVVIPARTGDEGV
jgi:hypothetical protein